MKRLIKNTTSIYGMSFPRKKALKVMESLAEEVSNHVIECVVYKDLKSDTLPHWIDEIAVWLCKINRVKCDSKLKEKDYRTCVFSTFGTTREDAELSVSAYYAHNRSLPYHKRYPEFEITDDLVSRLFSIYRQLIDEIIPILVSGKVKSVNEWIDVLTPILT